MPINRVDVEEIRIPVASNSVTVKTSPPQSITVTSSQVSPVGQKEGSAKGKREASGPIVTTSDEEEVSPPSSPRKASPISQAFHDHDYESIGSPGGSSTASGPTYIRQPGFSHHAHTLAKTKKKKTAVQLMSDKIHDKCSLESNAVKVKEPCPPQKVKPRREPLPMRMRALPQSFWQQPNIPHNVSPAQTYPLLPPLFTRDGEEIQELRPVSPSDDKDRDRTTKAAVAGTPRDRKLTVANTDLLFKLFDVLESKEKVIKHNNHTSNHYHHLRRPRTRKIVPINNKSFVTTEDPCMVECVTDKLFPQLTLEQGRTTLHVMTIRGEGGKPISLPSLTIEQNYPAMLSELVAYI